MKEPGESRRGSVEVSGVQVPRMMYGTAWKEERTAGLTLSALEAGFRAVDTANQRKHYVEAGVGQALSEAATSGVCAREEVFVQTKFTFIRGQDHRLPYERGAALGEQVRQSFISSLDHLGTSYLDAYILHGPSESRGLTEADWEVWRQMEEIHREGGARLIGVSNVSAQQLEQLWEGAEVKPSIVQNRCYARHGWDGETRALCRRRGLVYQGFSLLTANRAELSDERLLAIAARRGLTPAQLTFAACLGMGMVALTGTGDRDHMGQDLLAEGVALSAQEIEVVETIASGSGDFV